MRLIHGVMWIHQEKPKCEAAGYFWVNPPFQSWGWSFNFSLVYQWINKAAWETSISGWSMGQSLNHVWPANSFLPTMWIIQEDVVLLTVGFFIKEKDISWSEYYFEKGRRASWGAQVRFLFLPKSRHEFQMTSTLIYDLGFLSSGSISSSCG